MLRFKDNKCNMLTFSVIFEQIHTVIYIYIYICKNVEYRLQPVVKQIRKRHQQIYQSN